MLVGLLHAGQIHAVGQRAHDLVEDMHDLRTRALQLLDDVHAGNEILLGLLEVVDLLDLLVQQLDLPAQALVALHLRVDRRVESQIRGTGDEQGERARATHGHHEPDLALLALLLTPGE